MDPNQTFDSGTMPQSNSTSNDNPSNFRSGDPISSQSSSQNQHTIGHAMQDFLRDMTLLIEREGQLLRAELSEKAEIIKSNSLSMVSALAFVFFGVQALVLSVILILAYVFEWWVAAAVVGVALLALGLIMIKSSKKALNLANLKPTKSVDTLNHIGANLKEKAHELYH